MRQWWPFLIVAMLFYAMLPRLILWLLAKRMYGRQLQRAFCEYPGAGLVLARMRTPLVTTQSREPEQLTDVGLDKGLLLLDWAGTLANDSPSAFDGLRAVPPDNVFRAGLGSLADDQRSLTSIDRYRPQQLLVAVKSWEPPMADLMDFLQQLQSLSRCTLSLVPLDGKAVTDHSLQEWQHFAHESPLGALDVQPLRRV
jgi:hypothetical protein